MENREDLLGGVLAAGVLTLLLVLAGCGGEAAAPTAEPAAQEAGVPGEDPGVTDAGGQDIPAAARPQVSVEMPVRSPGALAEADAGAGGGDLPAFEIQQPDPPESAPEPVAREPEPPPEEPPQEAVASPAARPSELLAVLPVRDLEAAVAFYRDGLGFTREEGGLSGEVVLGRGGTRLALRRTDEGVAPRSGASGWNVPRSGLVLRLEVDDLEAVRARLSGAGLTPRRARGGGVAVLDPAGHLVVVSGS
ncbi:MAG TPA: VOC family protein [Thermoanaerobaculia bacterium]|nr:VOC family protein [Thermoanaerobaculia bacterium]